MGRRIISKGLSHGLSSLSPAKIHILYHKGTTESLFKRVYKMSVVVQFSPRTCVEKIGCLKVSETKLSNIRDLINNNYKQMRC